MDRSTIDRMRAWGASDEVLDHAERELAEQEWAADCEVWPENWALWGFFQRVSVMWVRAGMDGRRSALDWPGIEVVARGLRIGQGRWARWVDGLLTIQAAVLEVDAHKAEQKATRSRG